MCDNAYCEKRLRAQSLHSTAASTSPSSSHAFPPHAQPQVATHTASSNSPGVASPHYAHGPTPSSSSATTTATATATTVATDPPRNIRTTVFVVRDKRFNFCAACKALAEKKQFCYYCVQVYRDREQDVFDGKEWICCDDDVCRKWTHIKCEKTSGGLHDPKGMNPYKCPTCREESKVGSGVSSSTSSKRSKTPNAPQGVVTLSGRHSSPAQHHPISPSVAPSHTASHTPHATSSSSHRTSNISQSAVSKRKNAKKMAHPTVLPSPPNKVSKHMSSAKSHTQVSGTSSTSGSSNLLNGSAQVQNSIQGVGYQMPYGSNYTVSAQNGSYRGQSPHPQVASQSHPHPHSHNHGHSHAHPHSLTHTHAHQPQSHSHMHGHSHTHANPHVHSSHPYGSSVASPYASSYPASHALKPDHGSASQIYSTGVLPSNTSSSHQTSQHPPHHNSSSSAPLSVQPADAPSRSAIDFSRLDVTCLRRYHKRYHLKIKQQAPKQELAEAVAMHFAKQTVIESEILSAFFAALSRQ
eukprot:TRINITY_DN1960_c0_g1_i1.p1 TRINITY_DN1960_c0_g1~~TRINITY_DN1960_c0_g1_i1.p1  ORF type:complete len:523 (+),score=90.33 TRINITY_DN1960_c0_g1_i1:192-1760(+)